MRPGEHGQERPEPWDVPMASGQGDKETPASESKSGPREHTLKRLKSPSRKMVQVSRFAGQK